MRPSTAAAAALLAVPIALGGVAGLLLSATSASAALAPVDVGTAASYAVLGASTVTNTGPTVISGDLGLSPGSSVTGFPPGTVTNGAMHITDSSAAQAQQDTTTAYNNAAALTPTGTVTANLGGQTLGAGVYRGTSLALSGTLTLDAANDPAAVFVFQSASTLITAPNSTVALIRGASACNVFWQVGSSATVDVGSVFAGTVAALSSVTANTGAVVNGRLLARTGAVTLDSNSVTRPLCGAAVVPPAPAASPTASPTVTPSASPTASPTVTPSASPTASPTVTPSASPTASPTVTPSASPTVVPTATPTVSPTAIAVVVSGPTATSPSPTATSPVPAAPAGTAVNGGVPATSTGTLPRTGAPLGTLLSFGLGSLLLGAVTLWSTRRPQVGAHARRR